jgi:hypothetical protein
MIIALLFNWRAYPQDLNYWHEIREAVFSTGLIQRSVLESDIAVA